MKQSTQRGFTLIELLVVISIILIVSSVIFIGGSGGDGAKLSAAQRIVSGIAQGARGQAILKNAKTRLIIYTDAGSNANEEKKLRFFGIIYEATDTPTGGDWIAATQGTSLPEGVYFNSELSRDWPDTTMLLEYPRQSPQIAGSGDEFYYYEYNSNGTMATNFANAWLALQVGTLRPGSSGDLEVDFDEPENEFLKAALIFRRAGTTTPVTDPEAITP